RAKRPLLLPFPAERKRKGPRGLSAFQFFFPCQGNQKKASVMEIVLVHFDKTIFLFQQAVAGHTGAFCAFTDVRPCFFRPRLPVDPYCSNSFFRMTNLWAFPKSRWKHIDFSVTTW
ncbi:MAG: hypothetical protein KIC46_02460, partial [Clostridiales bacterium]|nr:hypothetical protein [Clostridiales bacterium]